MNILILIRLRFTLEINIFVLKKISTILKDMFKILFLYVKIMG